MGSSQAIAVIQGATGERARDGRRLLGLIAVATIPAVVVGAAIEHALRDLFGSPVVAAAFLAANGVPLLFADLRAARSARLERPPNLRSSEHCPAASRPGRPRGRVFVPRAPRDGSAHSLIVAHAEHPVVRGGGLLTRIGCVG